MSDVENDTPTNSNGKHVNALELSPQKKASKQDPLVHQCIMCIIHEVEETPDEDLTTGECCEHKIFKELLKTIPNLECVMTGSEEDLADITDLLRKGVSGARGDDTKTLKGNILEWITPKGQSLNPPLYQNQKVNRGFHHDRTGVLLCPIDLDWSNKDVKTKLRLGEESVTGDQWPIFLYTEYKYNHKDSWNGLLQSDILVKAFKHVFTSPSSVDKDPKAHDL